MSAFIAVLAAFGAVVIVLGGLLFVSGYASNDRAGLAGGACAVFIGAVLLWIAGFVAGVGA